MQVPFGIRYKPPRRKEGSTCGFPFSFLLPLSQCHTRFSGILSTFSRSQRVKQSWLRLISMTSSSTSLHKTTPQPGSTWRLELCQDAQFLSGYSLWLIKIIINHHNGWLKKNKWRMDCVFPHKGHIWMTWQVMTITTTKPCTKCLLDKLHNNVHTWKSNPASSVVSPLSKASSLIRANTNYPW